MNFQGHQEHLEKALRAIFPRENIITNAKQTGKLQLPSSKWFLELDVWIPSLNLGFEFQDEYHFVSVWYYQHPLTTVKQNDNIKAALVLQANATLILVPLWWDLQKESLLASIKFLRPELASTEGHPIPLNPPRNFFTPFKVPDVGDVMLASFLQREENVAELLSPSSPWWLGEKYDGIRCIWNPFQRKMYTRRGNEIALPQSHFRACIKIDNFMDCELWGGRRSFGDMQKNYAQPNVTWANIRAIVFDDPSPATHNLPFEKRYRQLISIGDKDTFFILAMRVLCKLHRQLKHFFRHIISDGGEGVILRKPKSIYEGGRSESLIKIKAVQSDTEALVVGVSSDRVTLKLPNQITFSVCRAGFSDIQLKKGDITTIEYDNVAKNGKPVNPVITRIRTDTDWRTVVLDFVQDQAKGMSRTNQSITNWNSAQHENLKSLLINLAIKQNLEHDKPETWYNFNQYFAAQKKHLPAILFKGNFAENIKRLFPELNLDANKFETRQKRYWGDIKNRKMFFDTFASHNQFDPLVAANWHKVTLAQIQAYKGFGSIMHYYQESFPTAISHLYPTIGVKRDAFVLNKKIQVETSRHFFDDFALDNGFDPFVPENWYPITAHQINARKMSDVILRSYHNFIDALVECYPDIAISRNKFYNLPRNHWSSTANRKEFFDAFAKTRNVDPLEPGAWYKISPAAINATNGGPSVLAYYGGDITRAIRHLYPTVTLDESLVAVPYGHWTASKNRREFFDNFAAFHRFDPLNPQNWYQISRKHLAMREGYKSVIRHHGNNFKRALIDLYPNIGLNIQKFV